MANLPLLEVKDEITEVGVMIDDRIKDLGIKLDKISSTLKSLFSIDKQTKEHIESILKIDERQYNEERTSRGLDLEKERESGGDGKSISEKFGDVKKAVGEVSGAAGILTGILLSLGGAYVAFKDDVDEFMENNKALTRALGLLAAGLIAWKAKNLATRVIGSGGGPTILDGPDKNNRKGPRKPRGKARLFQNVTNLLQDTGGKNKLTPFGAKQFSNIKDKPAVEKIKDAGKKVTEPVTDIAKKGGQKAVSAGSSLLRGAGNVLGKAFIPLQAVFSAYDAYSGFTDPNALLGKGEEYEASTGEKVAAGVGSVVEGLTFGLADGSNVTQGLADFFGLGNNEEPKTKVDNSTGPIPNVSPLVGMVPKVNQDAIKKQATIAPSVQQNLAKSVQGVKKTPSGNEVDVKVKVVEPSAQAAIKGTSNITNNVKQGDNITNVTNISGNKVAPGVMPNATNPTKSYVNYGDLGGDPVVDGP